MPASFATLIPTAKSRATSAPMPSSNVPPRPISATDVPSERSVASLPPFSGIVATAALADASKAVALNDATSGASVGITRR